MSTTPTPGLPLDLAARLEEARRRLLDLSTRNRLLALPAQARSRGVLALAPEDPGFVLAELLAGRGFGFEAAGEEEKPAAASRGRRATKPAAKAKASEGVARADAAAAPEAWRRDSRLRADLPPSILARRLRDLMTDARTAREETGVATLSLALGALAWRDPAAPGTERRAPLALLPVALEREGVSRHFRLRAVLGAEPADNLSLREKLRVEFGTALPEFDPESYTPEAWAAAVAQAVAGREGWRVEPEALSLGLFSFARFLMWRDLDPALNPGLLEHPLVRALAGGEPLPAGPAFPDDAEVDAEIPVERLDHMLELDGSQALAVEAVRRGGHLVIQGPPGTGKSQAITALIAQAVLDGKTVLFVAEKLAALEVVQRRLAGVGLGQACLSLHDEAAASKSEVLAALRATLDATPPPARPDRDAVVRRLGALRGRLNRHAAAMRGSVGAAAVPLHEVVGRLVALRARGVATPGFALPAAPGWDGAQVAAARSLVADLAARALEGAPQNPWRGVAADLTPGDRDRLMARLPAWIRAFAGAGAGTPSAAAPAAALEAWAELHAMTGLPEAPFAELVERLSAWAAEPEALPTWLGWRRAAEEAAGLGLEPVATALAEARLAPEAAADAAEHAAAEALLRAAMAARPELAAFDAAAQDRLVAEFRTADAARIELARAEAAAAHAAGVQRVRQGALHGLDLLRGEMEKRRGQLPVRELLRRAAPAVQAMKPVFLMSPLSVAQHLAPPHGLQPGLSFDLLVVDEASQVEPVDALGAAARCRQMVVVGDDRQMPPTRFFQRATSEEEGADPAADGPVAAAEIESLLGLANARGVPRALLRWHYRSRHESLIATSNAEFYGGRLLVLPSPRPRSPALGLSLVRVEGRWETGAGVNRPEAEAVAAAVIRHAKETPGETLGVAAFSVSQRDAILDAVEAARRAAPEAEPFFAAHPAEPFFVKNLENVQGDERDAMLISVGYAPDAEGRLAMRFGPLSMDGGERRLNVLITRAKRRCVVFSGIGAEAIDLARAEGAGVAALKLFLEHAAGAASAATSREAASAATAPFPAVLAEALREAGLDPVARHGSAGVFLDIAARRGEEFVLGVEADGADWAGLTACRDRERGRPAALAGMGWRLHRAWSLGWLAQPEASRAQLRAALGAEAAPVEAAAPAAPDTGLAVPYREAVVEEVPRGTPIAAAPFAKLGAILAEVVRQEAPIHQEAVLERARILWGLDGGPLGAADRAALLQGLRLARSLHGLREAAGIWRAGDTPAEPPPRDRRAAAPHLRRAALVPPEEVEAAARALLAAQPHATEEELARGVARLLGLDPGAEVAMAARIAALAGAGRIQPAG